MERLGMALVGCGSALPAASDGAIKGSRMFRNRRKAEMSASAAASVTAGSTNTHCSRGAAAACADTASTGRTSGGGAVGASGATADAASTAPG